MTKALALRDHLKSRSLSSIFAHHRFDKSAKYAVERDFAITIAESNYKVGQCTSSSIGQCIIDIGILGISLSPSLKQAYLIPYNTKINGQSTKICTLSISYMGMEQIAYRTGIVENIQTNVVRKGDSFKVFVDDNKRQIRHVEAESNRGEVTHAYCIASYASGHTHIEVMDRTQIMAVRDAAARKNNGEIPFTWRTSNPFRYEMYKKAVMRRAWKHWPKTANAETEKIVSIVDRTDPIDFTPKAPEKEEKGAASLTITDNMVGELCEVMDEAGIDVNLHTRWLNGLATHFAYPSIDAAKAQDFEAMKEQLIESCKNFNDRKSQGKDDEETTS